MKTTIDLANKANLRTYPDWPEGASKESVETFRALIVAERDKELLAVDMEPAFKLACLVSGYSEWYSLTQLAAARLQGAEEERKRAEVFAKHLGKANLHIRELEQQLAEKREPLTYEQADRLLQAVGILGNLETLREIIRKTESAHNIGGNHD